MAMRPTDCPVCRSNAGILRISPGAVIYEGRAWQVEHAYPTSLLGWLVVVLRRHAEALHELTFDEATELGAIQRAVAVSLQSNLGCVKEYAVCYGEAAGFSHLHLHLIPRSIDLDVDLQGGGIFGCLESPEDTLPASVVSEFCDELGTMVATQMAEPST